MKFIADYNSTPEANFVRCLNWKWRGLYFESLTVPPAMYTKLRDIFQNWGIGWCANKRDIPENTERCNVQVFKDQFDRIALKLPPEKVTCDEGLEYPWKVEIQNPDTNKE